MSADNFFAVKQHPRGGFAVVMGFASDEGPLVVNPDQKQYPTVLEAIHAANSEPSEYGVSVDPECLT